MTVQEPNQVGGKTQVEPENPCVTGPYPARPYGSSTKPAAAASAISPCTASPGSGARPHRLGGLPHAREGRGVRGSAGTLAAFLPRKTKRAQNQAETKR